MENHVKAFFPIQFLKPGLFDPILTRLFISQERLNAFCILHFSWAPAIILNWQIDRTDKEKVAEILFSKSILNDISSKFCTPHGISDAFPI